MSNRKFQAVGIHGGDGVRRSGYKLTCSECGAIDTIANSSKTHLPSDAVVKKFSQKSWTVGQNADRDLCPQCTRDRLMRRKPAELKPEAAAPLAEPPREMTREDRRILFAKINDVYLDETRGYSDGWTDRRVADDMNVPLAWVREIREENFGQEGLSASDRAALAAAEAFQKTLAELSRKADHISDLQENLAKEIDDLKGRFGPVARDVKDVHKAVVRA